VSHYCNPRLTCGQRATAETETQINAKKLIRPFTFFNTPHLPTGSRENSPTILLRYRASSKTSSSWCLLPGFALPICPWRFTDAPTFDRQMLTFCKYSLFLAISRSSFRSTCSCSCATRSARSSSAFDTAAGSSSAKVTDPSASMLASISPVSICPTAYEYSRIFRARSGHGSISAQAHHADDYPPDF
jgi:hypothetical protein